MSKIKFNFKLIILFIAIGLIAGFCSTTFLLSLDWVTNIRSNYHDLIWGLPIFGFIFGIVLKKLPHHIHQGVPYLIQELDNPKTKVSAWMTPFIFLSSVGTHLFGGSAGREGVGVIMGASSAHLFSKFFPSYQEIKPYLFYSGIAAGFSSIFGTPIAGIVFAFEIHHFKDIKNYFLILAAIVSSFTALIIPHLFHVSHSNYIVDFNFTSELVFYILIASITSGIGAHLFYWGLKGYTKLISKIIPSVEYKLFFGGFLISILVYITQGFDYIGIGTDMITKSFSQQMNVYDFLMKCLLTIMTLAIGFKGGEVTPLFFMGATFSNSVSSLLSFQNFSLSSALGMISLFGAVAGVPLASSFMAIELFGWKVGLCAFTCCYLARLIMGKKSVYRH